MNVSKGDILLWRKWTFYCATGELIGIGIVAASAVALNSRFGIPHTLIIKLFVLLSMLVAGAVEGFVLGTFQWYALKDKFQTLSKPNWVFYTVLAAVLGWLLGMLPSLFFNSDEFASQSANGNIDFENPFIFLMLSLGSGLLLGAFFGLFQWFVLRKYADKAHQWIIANALGWSLGVGWIFLFASIPTEQTGVTFNIIMGISAGLLAGLSVGVVTGFYLIRLKEKS